MVNNGGSTMISKLRRLAHLTLNCTCGFRTSNAAKVAVIFLFILPLSVLFLLYDDTVNPNLQDSTTHMKILNTRILPKSPRPRTCNNCNVFNFKNILKPKNVCSGDKQIDLLVMVKTVPKARDSQEAIRRTWAWHTRNNTAMVRHVFLFGGGWSEKEQELLNVESAKYADILQDDYKDAYYNLTYKTVSGYKWALKHCPQAKFILSTTDDSFINILNVLDWVRKAGSKNLRVQVGHVLKGVKVYRHHNKKHYISHQEFPETYYPDYASGTAFLYSMEAVKEIIQAAPSVPFFPIEDAWFGLVMREIKMGTMDVKGFDQLLGGKLWREFKADFCPMNGDFYSLHPLSAENMRTLWEICKLTWVVKS